MTKTNSENLLLEDDIEERIDPLEDPIRSEIHEEFLNLSGESFKRNLRHGRNNDSSEALIELEEENIFSDDENFGNIDTEPTLINSLNQ